MREMREMKVRKRVISGWLALQWPDPHMQYISSSTFFCSCWEIETKRIVTYLDGFIVLCPCIVPQAPLGLLVYSSFVSIFPSRTPRIEFQNVLSIGTLLAFNVFGRQYTKKGHCESSTQNELESRHGKNVTNSYVMTQWIRNRLSHCRFQVDGWTKRITLSAWHRITRTFGSQTIIP